MRFEYEYEIWDTFLNHSMRGVFSLTGLTGRSCLSLYTALRLPSASILGCQSIVTLNRPNRAQRSHIQTNVPTSGQRGRDINILTQCNWATAVFTKGFMEATVPFYTTHINNIETNSSRVTADCFFFAVCCELSAGRNI